MKLDILLIYTTKTFIKPDVIPLFVSKNDIQSIKIGNKEYFVCFFTLQNVYLYNSNDPT